MAFEVENPASEETLNRCDWEKIPLLYESIGKKFCQKPAIAYVNREKDLILTIHGGSSVSWLHSFVPRFLFYK